MFDIRCGGLAFKTTNIRIGTKESAFSSLCRCLMSPNELQFQSKSETNA